MIYIQFEHLIGFYIFYLFSSNKFRLNYSNLEQLISFPKIFSIFSINNIKSLDLTGTNFSLNDNEFKQISIIADTVNSETLILFWNLTLKALEELNYVFNQNLAVEMFLIKLLYLKKIKNQNYHVDNLSIIHISRCLRLRT